MAMSPSQLANFRRRTGGGPDPRPSPRSNQGVGPSNRYGRRSPIESSKAFDSSSRSPLGSASSPSAAMMRARQARAFAGRTANGGNSLGRMAFGGPNRGGNQTGSPALQPSQPSGYAMNNMTSGGDLAKAYYNNQKTQLPTTPATTPAPPNHSSSNHQARRRRRSRRRRRRLSSRRSSKIWRPNCCWALFFG